MNPHIWFGSNGLAILGGFRDIPQIFELNNYRPTTVIN